MLRVLFALTRFALAECFLAVDLPRLALVLLAARFAAGRFLAAAFLVAIFLVWAFPRVVLPLVVALTAFFAVFFAGEAPDAAGLGACFAGSAVEFVFAVAVGLEAAGLAGAAVLGGSCTANAPP